MIHEFLKFIHISLLEIIWNEFNTHITKKKKGDAHDEMLAMGGKGKENS